MNRILLAVLAATLCFTVAHTLQCYECGLGLWNVCLTSTIMCSSGQSCYSGQGTAAGIIKIKMSGCLANNMCNQTSDVTWPTNSTTVYKMTKTCCSTDLCNTASGLSTHTLTLTIASISSVLITKLLV